MIPMFSQHKYFILHLNDILNNLQGSLAMMMLHKLGLFKKLIGFLFGKQTMDFALASLGTVILS